MKIIISNPTDIVTERTKLIDEILRITIAYERYNHNVARKIYSLRRRIAALEQQIN